MNFFTIKKLKTLCAALLLGFAAMAQTWQNVGATDVVSAGGSSFNNLVIDAAGNYYLSYYDLSVTKGSVQKFNGTAWAYLGGLAGITTGFATYNSLSLDGNGNVFYTNQGSGLEVRQFNGTAWSQLTSPVTSTVNYQASAVSSSNVLFTYSSDGSGTVRRLVNSTWEQVGNAGFASGATFAEMVIGSNNMVYTCNVAGGNAQVYENSVTASSSNSWTLVGGATVGAAASSEQYTSDIAIDADNNLYVAYVSNSAGGNKLNVKKFNGNEWVQLGAENFSAGKTQHVAVAVSAGGQVFVVASRWENDNYLLNTAYAFDAGTNTWTTLGGDFVSDGQATYNDLAVDNLNHYLVLAYSQNGTKVKRITITEDEEPQTDCANTEPGNNAGDTGCVSFTYNGQTVSYTTVRGADGNIWLQQNLGADGVATAMDQEAAYGDLFQWGRWDDGHQKRTSAITATAASPNNPSGLGAGQNTYITSTPAWWSGNTLTDTWTAATPAQATDVDGCDPCKALGEGWVMPTQANWEALVTAENITNPASAFASNLKLPANGYRSNTTGGFTFNGQRGYYWSSTTSTTGAKYLYVGTTIANAGAGSVRGQGAGVRCIKMAQQQVQSVAVTTLNSVPATITTAGGTLQLVGTITPTAANQNVTWSITTGSEFATVSATGLVTATANGTVTVRATSVADATKFGELAVVINITPVCPSLTELYENFDTLTCCALGLVPECWESIMINGSNQIISSTTPASGTSNVYMNGYGAGKIAIVVLPHFSNVNAGTHQFRFKARANSAGLLQFGYITDVEDADTFTILEDITINNTTYNSEAERVFMVPTTVPANARLAIRNDGSTWAGMYWDDVYWEPIAVTSVVVATQNNVPATITTQNGTRQLVATVNPSAASQSVTWSIVSGSEYATVDANGLVTATANGTVTVRATSVADTTKFDDIEITISYAIPVQGVVVSTQNDVPATITTQNDTLQLVATVTPANATNQNVTWSIASGSEFATVDANGLVTATANGTVTVRATSASNAMLYDEIEITISYVVAVESLEITTQNNVPAEITVIDGTLQLVATITPADADNQEVVWTIVSGAEYATIDANGLVTATNNGTVVVRATSVEDATVYDEITITLTNQLTCQELYPGATEPITLVNFAGINNESPAAVGGAFTESFMSVTGTAERGEEYVLTVKGNTNGDFAHTVTAYIDWNQDMDFSDEGEVYTVGTLQNTTGTDAAQVTLAITIPETATLGNATLRISKRLAEGEIECNTTLYGQTEYYTLTVTETNGIENHNLNTVSIYPNPVNDVLNIEANQQVVLTEVYNALGQAVVTAKGNTVNVTGLSNGVYMVKVSLENGASQTIKIVKQ